jgi:hypothetical protein
MSLTPVILHAASASTSMLPWTVSALSPCKTQAATSCMASLSWRVCARTSRGRDGQQTCFSCCPFSMLKHACFRGTGKRAAAALTLEKVITLENVLDSVRRRACRWHPRVPGCDCAPCSVLFHHTILTLSSLRRNKQHLCLRRRGPDGRWRQNRGSTSSVAKKAFFLLEMRPL